MISGLEWMASLGSPGSIGLGGGSSDFGWLSFSWGLLDWLGWLLIFRLQVGKARSWVSPLCGPALTQHLGSRNRETIQAYGRPVLGLGEALS